MDDNDLYLHIRRKIVTFSQQANNITNHISIHECTQLKPKSFKQFEVKAPKGLWNGAVYEINYNAKGMWDDVIPILDTFIARKHQKSIRIMLIDQSDEIKWIPQVRTVNTDNFITSNQVQLKRPVQHQDKQQLSPKMKRNWIKL